MLLLVATPVTTAVAQQRKATTTQRKTTQRKTTQRKNTTPKKPAAQKPMTRQAYEQQQKELQRQIRDTERQINANTQDQQSRSQDIKKRQGEIAHRQRLIASQQQQIALLSHEEDSLGSAIENLRNDLITKQALYANSVTQFYRQRNIGRHEAHFYILSADDIQQAKRRQRALRYYSAWRHRQGIDLSRQRQQTEVERDQLTVARQGQEQLLASNEREKASLTRRQAQQEEELRKLQSRGKELQSSLARDKKRMAEVERTIQRMIAEEVRKAEEAKRRAEAARQKNNTTTPNKGSQGGGSKNSPTYQVDESYKRLTGSFAQNQGRLPYPVDAAYNVLQRYNASAGNSSIVLGCRKGAHACSVYEGVVLRTFATSEEWTIIIQHGDYRSVYMNLQNVSVKEGQKVSTHQVLGTLKTEPDGSHSELRFWIYFHANAVNPERWLKR